MPWEQGYEEGVVGEDAGWEDGDSVVVEVSEHNENDPAAPVK